MWFQDFQDGRPCGHPGQPNGISESQCRSDASYQVSAQSDLWFRGSCQHFIWRPSRISNKTILAILNLYVARMPPIKFRLNPTYGLGGDVVWTISRWPPWRSSWISERKIFSNSESLCHFDSSHQVSTQSEIVWEEMSFEEFQNGGHLGYWNWTILAILNLYVTVMPPIKFWLNLTYDLWGDVDSSRCAILDIGTERF